MKRLHTESGPCWKEFFKRFVMSVSDDVCKGCVVGGWYAPYSQIKHSAQLKDLMMRGRERI